jgi:hypothetical protein
VLELTSAELHPALIVADSTANVRPSTARSDIELVVRRNPDSGYLYVIVAKRGGDTARVSFAGLPKKDDGTAITRGEVLFEHVQDPPPLPRLPGSQVPRRVHVANAGFTDWFAPYDVHVYRFEI